MANTYTAEVKAQVIAEWMTGAALKAIARQHNIPVTTVRSWTTGLVRPLVDPKQNGPSLDELAWDLVGESFAALRAILRKAQDDSWLQKQDANNLAIFFGVTSDKLIRLLAAGAKQDGQHTLASTDA